MKSAAAPVLTVAECTVGDARAPGALAVLGHPISHSISPELHRAALSVLARSEPGFAAWRYERIDVPPDELRTALGALHRAGFYGLNLTIPHKVLALSAIESGSDEARAAGAVNTLRRTPTGWEGRNTDGYGLATAIREELGRTFAGADVALLGAGGAGRGAAVRLLAEGVRSLALGNRSPGRLAELLDHLRPLAGPTVLTGFLLAEPPRLPPGCLVINATAAGLGGEGAIPLPATALPDGGAVYDMVYRPSITPLVQAARARGLPAVTGLGMLVHQAAAALEWWTGRSVDARVMRRAGEAALL